MRRHFVAILLFWLPLAAMWLMMAIEQPAMNAVIARMPAATENLAAFGIAFSLGLVVESPILQLLSAATALTTDRRNYSVLLRFTLILSVSLVLVHALVSIETVFHTITVGLMNVPERIAVRARSAFVALLPFSICVAFRRLWQGVLIKYGKPHLVTLSMVLRLVATIATLWIGFRFFGDTDRGHVIGSVAVIVGVIVGAVAAYLLFAARVRDSLPKVSPGSSLSTDQLLRFYVPLSSTSVLFLASRPLLTYGIARSQQPVESLAAWPVVQSYLFLFNSLSISFQEVAVAMSAESPDMVRSIRRFAFSAGGVLSMLFAVAAVTPASRWWFSSVAGLVPELASLTVAPLFVLTAAPLLEMTKATARGLRVARGSTTILAAAVAVNTAVLLVVVTILPSVTPWHGGVVASVAYLGALIVENGVLGIGAAWPKLTARREGARAG